MPMLVSAGSISRQATSPSASRASSASRSLKGTTAVVSADVDLWAERARARHHAVAGAAVLEHAEGLVDGAVVAPVHDRDPRSAGEVAGEAQHEAVGVGGRHRHLPAGEAEAPAELAGDPGGVGRGEHRGDAALGALADRLGDRGQAVAGHRAGVAEAEVDVVDAVDVGEAAAAGGLHEQRERPRPPGHPRHRHAGQQVLAGLRGEPRRGRVQVDEALLLLGVQRAPAASRSSGVTASLTARCRRTWSRGTPRCPRSRPRGRSRSA